MLYLIVALSLLGIHFGVPLSYYFYAKNKWLSKPWRVKTDGNYKPKATIILPTYNEEELIAEKLDDLLKQNYSKDKLEIVVVDSASIDRTQQIVNSWAQKHSESELKLIVEDARRGKLQALNTALKYVNPASEAVIFTDADAYWKPEAVSKAIEYLADPCVGSVTACITYAENGNAFLEDTYRNYYNILRVAESKVHSTAVHNGPFLVIKAEILRETGLPCFLGSDDSAFGSFIALMGYRAIQIDDVSVSEPVRGNRLLRKTRRAQHLLLSFLETKRYVKKRGVYKYTEFEKVWKINWWLHVANPWLLVASVVLLIASATFYLSIPSSILIGVGLLLLPFKNYRTWVLQQTYLATATLRNLWTKDVTWSR